VEEIPSAAWITKSLDSWLAAGQLSRGAGRADLNRPVPPWSGATGLMPRNLLVQVG
jgi:hypothetical protein